MNKRKIEHQAHDDLDTQAVVATKGYLEIKSSGDDLGEEITLEEVIDYLGNSFKIASPCISLVGGIVTQKSTSGDFDILIETPTGDERLKEIIAHRISRAFPEALRERIHFISAGESGAFSNNMPLYDMTFERINTEGRIIEMSYAEKAIDSAYLEFPDEANTYKYVLQTHWRGKGVHGDLRIQLNEESLIGYTLFISEPDIAKEPVIEFEDAELWIKKPELWKINFETAEFKQSAIGVALKGIQPIEWLDVRGVTSLPTETNVPVGGTAQYPGVFVIVEQGTVEYGARKNDMAEYFIKGKALNGRYMFKQLSSTEKAIINLPDKDEERNAEWVMMRPEEQTPYVLTKHAVDIKYYPPKGASAIPKEVRDKIPDEYKYWEKDNFEEVRDALVANKEVIEHAIER